MDLDTQNLMSPPKATGDKADIQRVIEESAGSYTFKYPQKGDYRSAVIMHDINGDGTDEAVAFYKSNTPDGVSDITVIFIDRYLENGRESPRFRIPPQRWKGCAFPT